MVSRGARDDWHVITGGIERGDWAYINFFENTVAPASDHWSWAPNDAQYEMREAFWYQFGPFMNSDRSRGQQDDLFYRLGIDPDLFWQLWAAFYEDA